MSAPGMLWDGTGKPLLVQTSSNLYDGNATVISPVTRTDFAAPTSLMFRRPGTAGSYYSLQVWQTKTYNSTAPPYPGQFPVGGTCFVHSISESMRGDLRFSFAIDTLTLYYSRSLPKNALSGPESVVVPHTNGRDLWLINPMRAPWSTHVYRVTSAGINPDRDVYTTPIPRGYGNYESVGAQLDYCGQTKVSPNGKLVAMVAGVRGRIQLYDFDASTGILSNEREISDTAHWHDDFKQLQYRLGTVRAPYGLEFSNDSKKLYVTNISYYQLDSYYKPVDNTSSDTLRGELVQYDLEAGDQEAIRASRQVIVPMSTENKFAGLQLGPDKRIWVAQRDQQFISCIENPTIRGVGCGFVQKKLILPDSAKCTLGFPSMPLEWLSPDVRIVPMDICISDTARIPLQGNFITDSVVWEFDDPQTGAANTAYGKVGSHLFSKAGAYSVTATMYVGSVARAPLRQWIYVHEPPSASVTASRVEICEGDTVTTVNKKL